MSLGGQLKELRVYVDLAAPTAYYKGAVVQRWNFHKALSRVMPGIFRTRRLAQLHRPDTFYNVTHLDSVRVLILYCSSPSLEDLRLDELDPS